MIYDSFFDIKKAMLAHKCENKRFWQHDEVRKLEIGWICSCKEQFSLTIDGLKPPQDMTKEEYQLMSTPEGRIKLGEILSR
jgi:hypothetical protein